jgi:hypothetical protein
MFPCKRDCNCKSSVANVQGDQKKFPRIAFFSLWPDSETLNFKSPFVSILCNRKLVGIQQRQFSIYRVSQKS